VGSRGSGSGREATGPFDVDPGVAHPARVFDYLLGGTDNFESDREVAHHLYDAMPGGIDSARAYAHASRAFLVRAVGYLTGDAGIRQFVNLGHSIRVTEDVHEVAQRIAPDARVVYVATDAVVVARAHQLQPRSPEGRTAVVHSDLRDLAAMMQRAAAAATLDLAQPVAVILPGILHYVSGKADPGRFVAQLVDIVAPGSYLVVSHTASDVDGGQMAQAAKRQEELTRPVRWRLVPRSREEVTRLLDGLELVDPGVVTIDQWRPSSPESPAATGPVPWYGAVARKPDQP
jgi:hypothetical protein